MAITADTLTAQGLFYDLPGTAPVDHFLATLCTRVLGDHAVQGCLLLKITQKGLWEALGCFHSLCETGRILHGQPALNSSHIMAAVRQGFATLSTSDLSVGIELSGSTVAVGLTRPHLGVLLLESTTPLTFTEEGVTLLRTAGELWMGRGVVGTPSTTGQVDASTSSIIFTDRQREVLSLLSQGLTNQEIGKHLAISASLAKQEVAFLAHALQAKNRLDVVVQAQRQGILAVGT